MNNDSADHKDQLRQLPSVDKLVLESEETVAEYGHQAVTLAIRDVLQEIRELIIGGDSPDS